MAKQVFDLLPAYGISLLECRTLLRSYKTIDPSAKKYGYYDPTSTPLNFEVIKGGFISPVNNKYSIDQRFKDNIQLRGIEDPNVKKKEKGLPQNRRTLIKIILGGSTKRMNEIAFGNIDFVNEDGYFDAKVKHSTIDDSLSPENFASNMTYFLSLELFLKYADLEVVKAYGNQKKTICDGKDYLDNKSGIPVKYIDSRWLREIIRSEGFKVRGHFRLQPYKDDNDEWQRKLIYIDEFEKHGYHRRALRDIY